MYFPDIFWRIILALQISNSYLLLEELDFITFYLQVKVKFLKYLELQY